MTQTGLVGKRGLTQEDIAQIRALEAACGDADGLRVKFNWELMLGPDTPHVQGFCWYEDGRIVAFAPLDGFGGDFEVTGAVLPAHRRRGIFRRLFGAARAEAGRHEGQPLLLVSYPGCPAGSEAARRLGTTYRFSEYHMEAEAAAVPPLPRSRLRLKEAAADDVSELARAMGLSFGGGRWSEPEALHRALELPDQRLFLAMLGPETVGQIGSVVSQGGDVYLRAVGVLPQWRRQGHGRQMLAATVHLLMAEGYGRFALDVETENAQALGLYRACGFRETMAYDYSHVPPI